MGTETLHTMCFVDPHFKLRLTMLGPSWFHARRSRSAFPSPFWFHLQPNLESPYERYAVEMASASDWLVLDLGIPGGDDASGSSASGHSTAARPTVQPTAVSSSIVRLQPGVGHNDLEDLELLEHINAGSKRKFRKGSWEHAAHARSGKAMKKLSTAVAQAETVVKVQKEKLEIVAHLDARIRSAVSLPQPSNKFDETKALVLERHALTPVATSSRAQQLRQARSAFFLTECIEDLQRSFTRDIAEQSRPHDSVPHRQGRRVCLYMGQWDETSQRLKSFLRNRLKAEYHCHGRSHVQVMMQQGQWVLATVPTNNGEVHIDQREPVIMRALTLQAQDADAILEGVFLVVSGVRSALVL